MQRTEGAANTTSIIPGRPPPCLTERPPHCRAHDFDSQALFSHGTPWCSQDSLFTGEDETFAFRRAISRLHEMQSEQYLAARAREANG